MHELRNNFVFLKTEWSNKLITERVKKTYEKFKKARNFQEIFIENKNKEILETDHEQNLYEYQIQKFLRSQISAENRLKGKSSQFLGRKNVLA